MTNPRDKVLQRALGSLARGRFALIGIAAVAVPFLLVVRGGGDAESTSTSWGVAIFAAFVGLAAILAVLSLGIMFAGLDPEAGDEAARLTVDPSQHRLAERWIRRARWARNVGGVTGVVIWAFGTSGAGDLLLWGCGGIALGAVIAELHLVRAPKGGVRSAGLEVRSVTQYLGTADLRAMIAIAAGGAVLFSAGLVTGRSGVVANAAACVLTIAIVGGVQRRVARRRRPGISDDLKMGDDLIRTLAIVQSLARPGICLALVFASNAAFGLEESWGVPAQVIAWVARIAVLVIWWRNRRLGLERVTALTPKVAA